MAGATVKNSIARKRSIKGKSDNISRRIERSFPRRDDSILIAVVCDIRGFTTLTTRMDEYFHSSLLLPSHVGDMLAKYSSFMERTQKLASEMIVKPLKDLGVPTKFAVKSTGDGFLVGVEVAKIRDHDNKVDFSPEDNKTASRIALRLVQGLKDLVIDAELIPGNKFGGEVYKFLKEWALHLGVEVPKREERKPDFRVAGALAMGMGILEVRNESTAPYEAKAKKEIIPTHDDAYGHPVNLAFRLCDASARASKGGGAPYSPYILLDRRVARSLLPIEDLETELHGWEIKPFELTKPLKGIEETWFYALSDGEEEVKPSDELPVK